MGIRVFAVGMVSGFGRAPLVRSLGTLVMSASLACGGAEQDLAGERGPDGAGADGQLLDESDRVQRDGELITLDAKLSAEELGRMDDDGLVEKIYGTGLAYDETYSAVRLLITQTNGTVEGCSGVLLNNHTLLTAAHCITSNNSVSAGNVWRTVRLIYEAPNSEDLDVTKSWFFYTHPSFPDYDYDYAVGANGTSLGLTERHFATLYRGSIGTNFGFNVAGSGAPDNDPMLLPATGSPHSGHVDWTSVNAWQGACAGDSGAPGLRTAGITVGGELYRQSVPVLMSSTSTVDALPEECNNNGNATVIKPADHAWIEDIVEFWPNGVYTCSDYTNAASDPVSWCWNTQ